MPEPILYEQVYDLLYQSLDRKINKPTLKRLTLLVLGIIRSKSASPGAIAKALDEPGLTNATAESIESGPKTYRPTRLRQVLQQEKNIDMPAQFCYYHNLQSENLVGLASIVLKILKTEVIEPRG